MKKRINERTVMSEVSMGNKFHTVDCCKNCFDNGLTYKVARITKEEA